MVKEFAHLTEEEYEFMLRLPLLIVILVAGADGNIDRREMKGAMIVASRKRQVQGSIGSYFNEVANDFEDKLKVLIQQYPYDLAQREAVIITEISHINSIWPKLPLEFSSNLYFMLLEIARKVATASGGWLGINAVAPDEAKFLSLPMIEDPSKK